MEFEYTDTIWIEEEDINKLVELVKEGFPFGSVFNEVMAHYGDDVYYSCGLIADAVEKEVMKRVKILLENEIDTSAQL